MLRKRAEMKGARPVAEGVMEPPGPLTMTWKQPEQHLGPHFPNAVITVVSAGAKSRSGQGTLGSGGSPKWPLWGRNCA